ncbi:MAG TPA: glycosyltransferase family 4 protein [Alphaproteobacteria bacterium]|nr:glycosyltransferase family 4 protein [Alphaproteobacteria bacterium]
MNILYLGFDIEGVGGIATYSRHQVRALRDLGHRLFTVSLNKQDIQIERGFADRHLPFGSKYRALANFIALLRERAGTFDAMVINHAYLAPFGWLARTITGAPYVVNVYNIDILTRLQGPREFAFGRADLVIADCQYTIDRLPQFHRRVPPVGLLYDPVDTRFFRPISQAEARREIERRFQLETLDERFVATTVAFLGSPANKGHHQTIDALRQLNDPRLLYIVVGDGPMRLAIEDYARQAGVAAQVRFLGLVEQSALPFLYSAADVAVLVSRGGPGLGEAVPLGLIEAAACGVPFICGNQDGSVEAISPTHANGFAVDPENPAELAARLRELAADPALRQRMGANGKRFVDEVFVYEKFTERQGELLVRNLGLVARPQTPAVAPARATVSHPSADAST